MIGDYQLPPAVLIPASVDAVPADGGEVVVPDTPSIIVNVLLWPEAELASASVDLPIGYTPGQRVFIYADKAIAMLTVKTDEPGIVVRNSLISANEYDLYVFSRISESIWARVTS